MRLDFSNKNILIVGASKGIGKGIALAFAKESCNSITIVARTKELLLSLKEEMELLGCSNIYVEQFDVMNGDNNEFAKTLLSNNKFDIIIHCVGGSLTSRDYLGPVEDFEHALQFNALHAISMNSVFMKNMIQNNIKGKIIHVSSISAVMLRGNPLYASAKAYLNAYITSVGRCVAPFGISLMSVMPGAVTFENSYWDIKQKNGDPAVEEFLRQHQAIGRFGTVDEIANFVLLLASDKTSFVCGANLSIDGGNM